MPIPTFDHYPSLNELMPLAEINPGFRYALSPPELMGFFQDGWDEEDPVTGDKEHVSYSLLNGSFLFRVIGPKGECDLLPLGSGKPIRGLSSQQCPPEVLIHREAETRTGLPIDEAAAFAAASEAAPQAHAAQG